MRSAAAPPGTGWRGMSNALASRLRRRWPRPASDSDRSWSCEGRRRRARGAMDGPLVVAGCPLARELGEWARKKAWRACMGWVRVMTDPKVVTG